MNAEAHKEAALQQATEWFARLDSGAVNKETKADFFTWLDADELHQQAYIEIEQLWGNLELAERLPVDEMLNSRGWFTGFLGSWRGLGSVFSILALVGAALLYTNMPAEINEVQYSTAIGERRDFLLPDGSLLQLNTDSAVTVRMEESRRVLTLQHGEAYFDIAPNSARPLTVNTAGGSVRVLGTQFNIRQIGSKSTVSVVEGRVAVMTTAHTGKGGELAPELTLVANQQANLQEGTPPAAATIEGLNVAAWRQGQLIYDGATLADVVVDLNRYFPGSISLDDATLGELEIVGVINLQNKTSTLAALEATFPVQVVAVTEDQTLIRPRD